jgi:hypothetical protein
MEAHCILWQIPVFIINNNWAVKEVELTRMLVMTLEELTWLKSKYLLKAIEIPQEVKLSTLPKLGKRTATRVIKWDNLRDLIKV